MVIHTHANRPVDRIVIAGEAPALQVTPCQQLQPQTPAIAAFLPYAVLSSPLWKVEAAAIYCCWRAARCCLSISACLLSPSTLLLKLRLKAPCDGPVDGGSRMLLRSPSIDRAARHQLADLWGGRHPPQAPLARPWALWAARLSNGGPLAKFST